MNRLKWWIRHCFKIKDCKHCCLWCQYYKSCVTDWAEPVKKEKPHYDFDTSRLKAGTLTPEHLEAKVLTYDQKFFNEVAADMNDSIIKIKPCPLCGDDEINIVEVNQPTIWWDSAMRGEQCYCIYCFECGLSIKDDYKPNCIEKWNNLPRRDEEHEDKR